MGSTFERCNETVNRRQCIAPQKFNIMTQYGTMKLCREHAAGYAAWRAEGIPPQRKPLEKWFSVTVSCSHAIIEYESVESRELETIAGVYSGLDHYIMTVDLCDNRGQRIRVYPF